MELFNAADFLVHRRVRQGLGDKVAVIGSGVRTYQQLSDEVSRLAAGFRGLGLQRNDRIVLVMADDIEMASTILAAFHAGLVAVPVSTMLTGRELEHILRDSRPRAVVATEEYLPALLQAVEASDDVDHLIVSGCANDVLPKLSRPTASVHAWAGIVGAFADPAEPEDAEDPALTRADEWALWLYTSGTTGTPKAAMHRHASIRHVYESYGRRVLGIRPEDRCLSVAKLFFAYGIGNSLFFPLAAGATTILQPARPAPRTMCDRIAATAPSLFFGVPTFYASLLRAEIPDTSFQTVRLCVSAGEALPVAVQARFRQRFGVDILDGIGSTEALHIFLSNRPEDICPGTTGKPVPGYRIEIRDTDGRIVGRGTPGDLYVSGDSIALGYWQRPGAEQAVFHGDWLRTGDTYFVDDAGYYHCLGRSNDLLKAGGIWVSPVEVEQRLLEHVAVADAAVVGVPDADGIDKPVALVVCAPGREHVGETELIDWCREGLAAFKLPRAIQFTEQLPKTATGKPQRYRVRQWWMNRTAAMNPVTSAAVPPSPDSLVSTPRW